MPSAGSPPPSDENKSALGAAAPTPSSEDTRFENSVRPLTFDDFVGQKSLTSNLKVFVEAAKKREEALDHTLFCGPPGLGKTTLAYILAHAMDSPITVTSGPAIEKSGDLAAILTHLQPKSVLFIDEVHRLNKTIEEILYPAMEDYKLDIVVGQGPGARTMRLNLPPFTLVGATTRVGLLTSPLRDRFGIVERLDYYGAEDIERIVNRSANIFKADIAPEAAGEIARRARGTPRIANRLLRRVRDFADVDGEGRITLDIAQKALLSMAVDERGFNELDRRILTTIIEKFAGGPVGLGTIAAAIGEEEVTIEDVYEPYLIQVGFLDRTPRGRCATPRAYEHFGHPVPQGNSSKTLWKK